jgi:hypothetical protein
MKTTISLPILLLIGMAACEPSNIKTNGYVKITADVNKDKTLYLTSSSVASFRGVVLWKEDKTGNCQIPTIDMDFYVKPSKSDFKEEFVGIKCVIPFQKGTYPLVNFSKNSGCTEDTIPISLYLISGGDLIFPFSLDSTQKYFIEVLEVDARRRRIEARFSAKFESNLYPTKIMHLENAKLEAIAVEQ